MNTLFMTLRTAFADSRANRKSFALQVFVMVVNDGVWIAFWVLFFHGVGTVRGWAIGDVMVLFSVLMTSVGIAVGLFSNSRRIGRMVSDGAIDETLVPPLRILPNLLVRKIEPSNIGDIVAGILLFLLACNPTPVRALVWTLGVICSATIVVGFLVLVSSLTFFVGGQGDQAELGLNTIAIFGSYPIDLFAGPLKVILFTLVPAGLVSGLPTNLVRHFDLLTAASLLGAAVGIVALASLAFSFGLRRYSSGSIWAR